MRRWYCVTTKPGAEHAVEQALNALPGAEGFLPILVEPAPSGGLRRVPLFRGYVFAAAIPASQTLCEVCRVRGVVRLLGNAVPTPVRRGAVDVLLERQRTLGAALDLTAVRSEDKTAGHYAPGAQVRVQQGPCKGFCGEVLSARKSRLRLLIYIFGRPSEVEVHVRDAQRIAA